MTKKRKSDLTYTEVVFEIGHVTDTDISLPYSETIYADDRVCVFEVDTVDRHRSTLVADRTPNGKPLYHTGRVAIMSRRVASEVYHLRRNRMSLFINPVVFNKLIKANHPYI